MIKYRQITDILLVTDMISICRKKPISKVPICRYDTETNIVKWKRPLDIEIRNTIKQKSILWKRYIRSKDPSVLIQ